MGSQKESAPKARSAAGISRREFARLDGCDDKTVRKGINTGHLKVLPNGKLSKAQVGTAWRKSNRQRAASGKLGEGTKKKSAPPKSHPKSSPKSSPKSPPRATAQSAASKPKTMSDIALERLMEINELWSSADAERVKENYLALLRELEYHMKSGAVVPIDQVIGLISGEFATVRTRLLSLPSELAPRVLLLKTAPEIEETIRTAVQDALEELTSDRDTAAA